MAIAFDNAGTVATADGGTSIVCNAPSGVAAGDLLVLIACQKNNGGAFGSITGWTQHQSIVEAHSYARAALWSRIADGSGTDTPTVSWSSAQDAKAVILRITGNHSSPYDNGNASQFWFGTSAVPSVTTAEANELLIASGHSYTGSFSTPSGWTSRVASAGGGGIDNALYVWTRDAATAGSYGGQTIGGTGIGETSIVAAFKQSAGGGGSTVRQLMALGVGQ